MGLSWASIFADAVSTMASYVPSERGTTRGGATGLWILANISYAGMRAQNHPSSLWRIVAFISGFPGTLFTYFVVAEGGLRAYGILLPPGIYPSSRSGPRGAPSPSADPVGERSGEGVSDERR